MPEYPGMTLRPYHILCAVCAVGEPDPAAVDPRSAEILEAVRQTPDMPITLRCNVGDVFVYQDPGDDDDTPESAEHNLKRDLEILHKINLMPGGTLPARIIFNRVLEEIEDLTGICCYDAATSDAWPECPQATNDNYLRARAKGIAAVIPPRTDCDMKRDKAESIEAMHQAQAIDSRPHILMCAVCQYGNNVRPPFAEDNLPEMIQLILKEPDTLIRMAPCADWMMCAPCPSRSTGLNACVNNFGAGGLSNQLCDLRMLQKLGLTYGSTMKARDLYKLIFERIPGTLEICRFDHAKLSVWACGCGVATTDSEAYEKGKQQLIADLGCA